MMICQVPYLPESLLRFRNFAILRGMLHIGGRKGTFSDADTRRYMRTWSVPGAVTGMVNWYRALRRRPPIDNPRVKPPTLVIWGNRDPYLQKGLAEASLSLCDNGEALWMEDGSHWVHIEEPQVVNKALIDFLTRS
ncbi:alpha/beta fold hydrolase [Microvirga terricola]|uniref:alpha/beta fold hydrolase n=1 Tax=Microvirga terricola TaxID=2719797 RepID=UPI001FED6ED4|nr:alpha/beta hydrolase [Microvirga terricola]